MKSEHQGFPRAAGQAEVGGETLLKGGAVDTLAAGVMDRLSQTNLSDISDDLATFIRRHPIPALLIGAGLGYAPGRSRRWGHRKP